MKIEEAGFYHTKIKDWPEGERPREKPVASRSDQPRMRSAWLKS